jgi:hypothetical protein
MGVQASTPPNFRTENRAPTTSDYKSFYIGDIWHQKATENLWMLTGKADGVATWTSLNSTGSGSFTDITITPGNLTLEYGDIIVEDGDIIVEGGKLYLESINYASTLRTYATGEVYGLSDGAAPEANQAKAYIVNNAGDVVWGTISSPDLSVTISTNATGIELAAAGGGGGTVSSFTTDDANIVAPTAGGNIDLNGGSNINTTGAVANTVEINLDDNITLTSITVDDITINNSLKSILEINTQAGILYTLQLTDQGKEIQFTAGAAVTLNIPTNAAVAFPVGTQIMLVQYGAGTVTVTPAGGVTLNSAGSRVDTYEQYSACVLIKQDADIWGLFGDIK